MIAVVDLGVGNFANVEKALEGKITGDPEEIEGADKLVLPGVGNFGEVAKQLDPLRDLLLERIEAGTPFLGICLGMQLLFPASPEGRGRGLGVLSGEITELPTAASPHIGWNRVFPTGNNPLWDGVEPGSYFYFVHSYRVAPRSRELIAATTEYQLENRTEKFPSAIRREGVFGVQFHPEKSGEIGRQVLKNFKEL